MRILLLSPNQISKYNWGHQLFRNEIVKQNEVICCGDGYKKNDLTLSVNQIIDKYYGSSKPDFILTYGWRYTKPYIGLGKCKVPKVHISVDYFDRKGDFKGTMEGQNTFFHSYKPDLVFGVVGKVVRNLKENKICDKVFLLPFSVDTNIYKDLNILDKPNDILAAFTVRDDVYPNRKKIHKLLSRMGLQRIITKRVSQYALVQAINKSKISVTSNNIFSSLSMRYTEVLASGGFLLADKPEDFSELGYVDGKHLVLYKDLNDLKAKIYYYLKHEKERRKIAKNGKDFVRTNHSCEIRARQFKEIVQKEL